MLCGEMEPVNYNSLSVTTMDRSSHQRYSTNNDMLLNTSHILRRQPLSTLETPHDFPVGSPNMVGCNCMTQRAKKSIAKKSLQLLGPEGPLVHVSRSRFASRVTLRDLPRVHKDQRVLSSAGCTSIYFGVQDLQLPDRVGKTADSGLSRLHNVPFTLLKPYPVGRSRRFRRINIKAPAVAAIVGLALLSSV